MWSSTSSSAHDMFNTSTHIHHRMHSPAWWNTQMHTETEPLHAEHTCDQPTAQLTSRACVKCQMPFSTFIFGQRTTRKQMQTFSRTCLNKTKLKMASRKRKTGLTTKHISDMIVTDSQAYQLVEAFSKLRFYGSRQINDERSTFRADCIVVNVQQLFLTKTGSEFGKHCTCIPLTRESK